MAMGEKYKAYPGLMVAPCCLLFKIEVLQNKK